MPIIAVINQKGGVGKTTTAVNLSAALAEMGFRTRLIDLDPQAHASLHLGLSDDPDRPSMYDVFLGEVSLDKIWCKVGEGLHVAPAALDLAAVEMELAAVADREFVLRNQMNQSLVVADSDYIVMDCPPSLGVITLNALIAASDVLLPLQPHFLALDGLGKLFDTIDRVKQRLNPPLRLAGVVLCLYETGTRLAAEVKQDVEGFLDAAPSGSAWHGGCVFEAAIRRNIRLAEAPSHGHSIFAYAPLSNGAADYRVLAGEVVASFATRAGTLPEKVA